MSIEKDADTIFEWYDEPIIASKDQATGGIILSMYLPVRGIRVYPETRAVTGAGIQECYRKLAKLAKDECKKRDMAVRALDY